MALGLEWMHFELPGKRERLAICVVGRLEIGMLPQRMDLAREIERPRLVPSLFVPASELEGMLQSRHSRLDPPGQAICLSQVSVNGRRECHVAR